MTVNPKSVAGRRTLSFTSLDEVVADAQRLVLSDQTRTLGNWPLSQLLTHLSSTIDNSIDGFPTQAPLFIRLIGPFLKGRMVKNRMAPGLKLPKATEAAAFPRAASPEDALEKLRAAVARTKTEEMRAPHPAFGKMTSDEWRQLHLRHAELHLSFAVPGPGN